MADEWDEAFAGEQRKDWAAAKPKDEPPQPKFSSVEQFVTELLAPTIRRPRRNSTVWCSRWWEHAEAVSRLEALWRSWEFLRLDGTTGMSVWWRDHLDPHLGFLTDGDRSPFSECRDGEHHEHPALDVTPAPPGYWGDA